MSVAGPPANAKDWDAADRWISKLSIWVAMAKGKLGVQVHRASEAMKKWTQAEGDKVDKVFKQEAHDTFLTGRIAPR
eukprot:8013865-Pyramimonas_sp.AAC.1